MKNTEQLLKSIGDRVPFAGREHAGFIMKDIHDLLAIYDKRLKRLEEKADGKES